MCIKYLEIWDCEADVNWLLKGNWFPGCLESSALLLLPVSLVFPYFFLFLCSSFEPQQRHAKLRGKTYGKRGAEQDFLRPAVTAQFTNLQNNSLLGSCYMTIYLIYGSFFSTENDQDVAKVLSSNMGEAEIWSEKETATIPVISISFSKETRVESSGSLKDNFTLNQWLKKCFRLFWNPLR